MVASSRLLHLAAAAATTAVATCFACPGRISGAGGCTPSSTSAASNSAVTPRTASVRRSAAGGGGGGGSEKEPSRPSTAMCAISPAQEESLLRTRGGAGTGLGEDDPGLSETDDEVWQIINAERRRQVCACAEYGRGQLGFERSSGNLSTNLIPDSTPVKMEPVRLLPLSLSPVSSCAKQQPLPEFLKSKKAALDVDVPGNVHAYDVPMYPRLCRV